MLGRVFPHCSQLISPLEDAISGLESAERIIWSDALRKHYSCAHKNDQLWIVTDGSVTRQGNRCHFIH
ncbi:hypothetical protein KUTeg_000904 [Tegillarca granosa]|uniref:Uncharacterized protein n=1 Tax=Tegillarca granosa TaxID=220873 RepID=A0ABQ9FXK3_TEGGR|nr:hypothetical protein KUTeg_000904 [Tegillarca granosa]